jgi:hypothetical protein
MEHRCDRRVDRQVGVVILMGCRAPIKATTQNISCGGLYLKTEVAAALKKNALVNVALPVGERFVTFPALVLRCQENAAALMFVDSAASRRQAVLALVSRGIEAKKATPQRVARAAGA